MTRRSITLKISLAFIFVSLIGAVISAFFLQQRTEAAFTTYLENQEITILVRVLADHFEENGNWDNLDSLMAEYYASTFVVRRPKPEDLPITTPAIEDTQGGKDEYDDHPGQPLVILDIGQNVIYRNFPESEQLLTEQDLVKAVPITLDGKVVGWVVDLSKTFGPFETFQLEFLQTVSKYIVLGAGIASILALIIGSILAQSLTRPLKELVRATEKVASGELGYQVPVRSKDELGHLATSFNQMSIDLERANAARKQMTADIAHDLRNPLSIIMGYTESLSDGKFTGSPHIFQTMHQEAQHLNYLVEDLRMLSLLDAGELQLNKVEVAPDSILERARVTYQSQAEEKGIRLEVDYEKGMPKISVDPERIAQVLGNLFTNGLRYVPEGGYIRFNAWQEQAKCVIEISDNGVGIAEKDLPFIFKRFYRGDKARQKSTESGLGLAIAKSLVEAQGGKISVSSALGRGTTFRLQFPIID